MTKCIFAYTPIQEDADLVPYANVSLDGSGDAVLTVRQNGWLTQIRLPSEQCAKLATALAAEFSP